MCQAEFLQLARFKKDLEVSAIYTYLLGSIPMSQRGGNGLECQGYTRIRRLWLSVESRPYDHFRWPFVLFGPGEATEYCNHSGPIVCCLTIGFFDPSSQVLLDVNSPELLLKEPVLYLTNSFMSGQFCIQFIAQTSES